MILTCPDPDCGSTDIKIIKYEHGEDVHGRVHYACKACGQKYEQIRTVDKEIDLEAKVALPKKVYEQFHLAYEYCLFCGTPSFQAHHIEYRSQGGKTTLENLCPACKECHPRVHGIWTNGKAPIFLFRNSENVLCYIEAGTTKVLDRTPHVPTAADGEAAHALHQIVVEGIAIARKSFYRVAQALQDIRDLEVFRVLGYDSFDAYLDSPEVALGRTTIYKYLAIQDHARRLELPEETREIIQTTDKDKVERALRSASTVEEAKDYLELAASNSRRDFFDSMDAFAGVEEPAPHVQHGPCTDHNCRRCGRKWSE